MIFRPSELTNVSASVTSNSIGGEESGEISCRNSRTAFSRNGRSVEVGFHAIGRSIRQLSKSVREDEDRAGEGNDNGPPNSSRFGDARFLVDNKESGDEHRREGGEGAGSQPLVRWPRCETQGSWTSHTRSFVRSLLKNRREGEQLALRQSARTY